MDNNQFLSYRGTARNHFEISYRFSGFGSSLAAVMNIHTPFSVTVVPFFSHMDTTARRLLGHKKHEKTVEHNTTRTRQKKVRNSRHEVAPLIVPRGVGTSAADS